MSIIICELCKEERNVQGEKPRALVELSNKTNNKKFAVYACAHCDGPVVELAS